MRVFQGSRISCVCTTRVPLARRRYRGVLRVCLPLNTAIMLSEGRVSRNNITKSTRLLRCGEITLSREQSRATMPLLVRSEDREDARLKSNTDSSPAILERLLPLMAEGAYEGTRRG
ncbi:hypothetical protein R5R35_004173 [Gryllus longicercus]|uniref:Uncharacterized protein n=1 Tax=Gryllus longicercus TaxID=2509291 RepID=A0AAN9VCQ1_9ORTH